MPASPALLRASGLAQGMGWILLYLLLISAPLIVLIAWPLPTSGLPVRDFSVGLGFAAMGMLGVQFLLTARFRRASAPFGLDILYYFHRLTALVAFAFLVGHYLILRISYPEQFGALNPLEVPLGQSAGQLALLLFGVLIVISLWRRQLCIGYEVWRVAHASLATIAFLAAVVHIELAGDFTNHPLLRWVWTAYTLFWVLLIAYVRLVKPWGMLRKPWRVTEVRPERGHAWTVSLRPEGHEGMHFAPGQFAWLTLRASPFAMKEHPFSIASSATDPSRIEFTIKALGDFTRTIGSVQPGELAYIEGPHGVFSVDRHPQAPGFVFIAGGVGIVPIMSMLRTLADRGDRRRLRLFYASKRLEEVIFCEEIEDLSTRLDLEVIHVIGDPPPDWTGEQGRIDAALLKRHLPPAPETLEYFLCGPKPMMDALQLCLRGLGVPLGHIHYDRFELV